MAASAEDLKAIQAATDRGQATNDAIARQRRAVELRLASVGGAIGERYEDRALSAWRGHHRPEWERLLADDINAGRWRGVPLGIYKLDRACRRVGDAVQLADTLEKAGTGLLSVIDNFDTTTAMGRGSDNPRAFFLSRK